jgi:hypothetical protein
LETKETELPLKKSPETNVAFPWQKTNPNRLATTSGLNSRLINSKYGG